jgi:ADP-dependent NAD(P)H-hydrate dehydratase / NAD(P)H-hydrate epimerase
VLVLGGAPGMGGAAMLAGRAALAAGAGRTCVARLDGDTAADPQRPELMPRTLDAAVQAAFLVRATVVCGCGGGSLVAAHLPAVLAHAQRLVLDADGLNALAANPALKSALRARAARDQPTVLTPHPLEAARLLGCTTANVQADRLAQAQALAEALQATVVLKGSGSVVASPGRRPNINPTGNARLGTGGSGDVLAGWLGGLWSQSADDDAHQVAAAAVWLHGRAAEHGDDRQPLRAADLIEAMAASLPAATRPAQAS